MKQKTERFELRLTPDEARLLRKLSKEQGISMAKILINMLTLSAATWSLA